MQLWHSDVISGQSITYRLFNAKMNDACCQKGIIESEINAYFNIEMIIMFRYYDYSQQITKFLCFNRLIAQSTGVFNILNTNGVNLGNKSKFNLRR